MAKSHALQSVAYRKDPGTCHFSEVLGIQQPGVCWDILSQEKETAAFVLSYHSEDSTVPGDPPWG